MCHMPQGVDMTEKTNAAPKGEKYRNRLWLLPLAFQAVVHAIMPIIRKMSGG
jgi:hypothetical protein